MQEPVRMVEMNYESTVKLKLFLAWLLFGSAIGSLWFGLTESSDVLQIRTTYIAAIVFSLLGIVTLKWPTSKKS